MDRRVQMLMDWETGAFSVTELSRRYGVSRDTVYLSPLATLCRTRTLHQGPSQIPERDFPIPIDVQQAKPPVGCGAKLGNADAVGEIAVGPADRVRLIDHAVRTGSLSRGVQLIEIGRAHV